MCSGSERSEKIEREKQQLIDQKTNCTPQTSNYSDLSQKKYRLSYILQRELS